MSFIELIESVLIEEKKTKKRKKKHGKSKAIVPYGYWAPWGLPGWPGYVDSGSSGEENV